VIETGRLQANPETYSPAEAVASLWESSTKVPSIQFASPWRAECDEKVSPEGTRLLWPAWVVTALGVRGTRLADPSDACDGLTGFTAAGSNLIDMGNQFAHTQSIGSSGRSPKKAAGYLWAGNARILVLAAEGE
jgi:hypothetical protein